MQSLQFEVAWNGTNAATYYEEARFEKDGRLE